MSTIANNYGRTGITSVAHTDLGQEFRAEFEERGDTKLRITPNAKTAYKDVKSMVDVTNKARDEGIDSRDVKWTGVAALVVAAALIALAVFVFVATTGFGTVGLGAIVLGVGAAAFGVYSLKAKASQQSGILTDAQTIRVLNTIDDKQEKELGKIRAKKQEAEDAQKAEQAAEDAKRAQEELVEKQIQVAVNAALEQAKNSSAE